MASIDLGPHARVAIAAAWIAGQAVLIATAGERADHAFGFRMFSEASTLEVHLEREVDAMSGHGTMRVPVKDGEWVAKDADGRPHLFKWRDRVHEGALATFDTTIFASYGSSAQLARLQSALDDVARHTPEDAETRRWVATVRVDKNGREATTVELPSAPR
jgi:hypothetical protein